MATDLKAQGATTEQESMERFGTPLPPNDPASSRDVRQDPNYIGATSFANIQRQYTPYQIEQATTRKGADVFWNPNVNIADIPREAPAAPLASPKPATPTSSNVMNGSAAAGTKLTVPDSELKLSSAVSGATAGYLDGINKRLDDLTNTQQQLTEQKKAAAEAGRQGIIDRFKGMLGSTEYEDRLEADRKLFQVTQTVNTLNTIRQKMADASSALNQGLIYEENQPVRMALLVGRSNELKKQGLAHIGALQSTAEILQGNIDLARAYADQSLAAVKADNAEQRDALDTLLNLYNDDLVDLTDEERDLIDYRKKLLEDEAGRLDEDKDKLLDLAQQFPDSFAKSGVTFVDSPEQAIQKMIPYLSKQEQMQMEEAKLKLESLRADIAKTKRTGTGGSGGSSAGNDVYAQMATDVLSLRNAGYPEDEINLALLQKYGSKFGKRTDLTAAIDQALQGGSKALTPEQKLEQGLSNWQLKQLEDGKAEYGYDPVTGKPTIVQKPEEPAAPEKKWWEFWK